MTKLETKLAELKEVFEPYKPKPNEAICRGCETLGSACGSCGKCKHNKMQKVQIIKTAPKLIKVIEKLVEQRNYSVWKEPAFDQSEFDEITDFYDYEIELIIEGE
jgi:hypothetical protein